MPSGVKSVFWGTTCTVLASSVGWICRRKRGLQNAAGGGYGHQQTSPQLAPLINSLTGGFTTTYFDVEPSARSCTVYNERMKYTLYVIYFVYISIRVYDSIVSGRRGLNDVL